MTVTCVKTLILLLPLLFINEIICQKLSLPDIDLQTSGSVGECVRCKILTDSFNHWLKKTSRGKHEGGDAAWEEAKLKSYARSEMRLVEVQEGLCSEVKKHKDHCYALAEEAEQPLEKWWFQEDPDSVDLHTWLCIETLKYCCPENHFGESCTPCPLYQNKICSGQGQCSGEGTRKGNGTCICNKGFAGTHCEDCSKNYYRASQESCERCHKACVGCSGDGPSDCKTCQPGWKLLAGECVDVNECLNTATCKFDQYCVNWEGSYSCKMCHFSCNTCMDAGPSNCTSCEPSNVLWAGKCIDNHQWNAILRTGIKKLAIYIMLLFITYYVYKKSKWLASLLIIIFAVCIYYAETVPKYNILDLGIIFHKSF